MARAKDLTVIVPELTFTTPQMFGQASSTEHVDSAGISTDPRMIFESAKIYGITPKGGQPAIQVQQHGKRTAADVAGTITRVSEDRTHVSHVFETSSDDSLRIFPTKMLADSVDRDRGIAEELVKETRCEVNARENELGTDLRFVWRRAFRYRAEREATANALRVREGKPIETVSACSDGGWIFDGTTLRFRPEIATAAPDRAMPLVLRVKP